MNSEISLDTELLGNSEADGSIQTLNSTIDPLEEPRPQFQVVQPMAPLFNRTKAAYERKKEMPAHRAAVEMHAKGYTAKEISERLGVTPVAVQDWLLQPCQQERLLNEIAQSVSEDQKVVELIRENVLKSIETYVEIRDNVKASDMARITAADRIIERRYGKANQPINRGGDVDLNNLPDSELVKIARGN